MKTPTHRKIGSTPLLSPLPPRPARLTRRQARKNWERIAAGGAIEGSELHAWLRHVALAIVEAEALPTRTAAERNARTGAFIAASGVSGKTGTTDPADVVKCLNVFALAHAGRAPWARGKTAAEFVAESLGWTADPKSKADADRRIRRALDTLGQEARDRLAAVLALPRIL